MIVDHLYSVIETTSRNKNTPIQTFMLRPKNKSPVSSHRSAFLNLFLGGKSFCLFANREILDTCIHGEQISHIQSMVAKRGLTNRANVHNPISKCRLKRSM